MTYRLLADLKAILSLSAFFYWINKSAHHHTFNKKILARTVQHNCESRCKHESWNVAILVCVSMSMWVPCCQPRQFGAAIIDHLIILWEMRECQKFCEDPMFRMLCEMTDALFPAARSFKIAKKQSYVFERMLLVCSCPLQWCLDVKVSGILSSYVSKICDLDYGTFQLLLLPCYVEWLCSSLYQTAFLLWFCHVCWRQLCLRWNILVNVCSKCPVRL